jgi:hypothetical protein
MEITTKLVKIVLYVQSTIFITLLLPLKKGFKAALINMLFSSKLFVAYRVLFVIYTVIFLVFLDSIFKRKDNDIFLKHLHERNAYLTGFTLFSAVVLIRFVSVCRSLLKEEKNAELLRKQANNQKKFVDGIVDENEKKSEVVDELNQKIKNLEILVKQYKNNANAYGELLEKYNELKYGDENRKKK